jgi:hypothetical protein
VPRKLRQRRVIYALAHPYLARVRPVRRAL